MRAQRCLLVFVCITSTCRALHSKSDFVSTASLAPNEGIGTQRYDLHAVMTFERAVPAGLYRRQDRSNNNNNNNNNDNFGGSEDPQTSLTLDSSQVQDGLALDGTQDDPNVTPSATSVNNFINFCLTKENLPLTNGAQVRGGSCNPTPMGVIAAQNRAPTCKFVFPKNLDVIQADQDFTIQMRINNLVTGNFVNAQSNYFAAPQDTNNNGIIIGESLRKIDSLDTTAVSDSTEFAFFKGLNEPAQNGILSADVPGGLPAGIYKMSSINSAANHQPVLVGVAQHGSLDDAVYFDNPKEAVGVGLDQAVAARRDSITATVEHMNRILQALTKSPDLR
ncbi:hypothetical protein OIV83_003280 [Microbotryomycetes sp. JL201]|nr:hypothetical protein OIV83_003280 [Microbotryomycetes sp. JL201]